MKTDKQKAKQLIEAGISQGLSIKKARILARELVEVFKTPANVKECNNLLWEINAYEYDPEPISEFYTKSERKILVNVALFPVFTDYAEDIELTRNCKMWGNMFIKEVERTNKMLMRTNNVEAQQQLVNIQQSFRQWVKDNFDLNQ